MSVEISSCMNDESTPQSQSVTTTLRSAPGRGRGGAGGTSPFAMRVVQSAITRAPAFKPHCAIVPAIELPRTPSCVR